MDCVKCDGHLEAVTLGGVEVDRCNKCSGIWFDLGELSKILEYGVTEKLRGRVAKTAMYNDVKIHCPKCGGEGKMVQVVSRQHKNVKIDTCSVCYGQWLDGGELKELTDDSILSKLKNLLS